MPIYEYSCKKCGHTFEELVFGDDLYHRKGHILLTIIIYCASEFAACDRSLCNEHVAL